MKVPIIFAASLMLAVTACTEKKQQKDETMIPVEKNDGIGNGAPPLDSVIKNSEEKEDATLKDSL